MNVTENGSDGDVLTVTGSGLVPEGSHNSYADGGWLTPAGFSGLFTGFKFHIVLIRTAPGVPTARAVQIVHGQLARAAPKLADADLEPAQSPMEMAELGQVKVLPVVLGVFLALLAIELTDVVFALDSIPAVLSITRNPFLAYTSNIMAVMGLRSLYFLLAHLLTKLRFLHHGLAAVLAFAALKMLSAHWIDIGPLTSLATVLVILAITVALSLIYSKKPNVSHV